jgi:hypothetical protein
MRITTQLRVQSGVLASRYVGSHGQRRATENRERCPIAKSASDDLGITDLRARPKSHHSSTDRYTRGPNLPRRDGPFVIRPESGMDYPVTAQRTQHWGRHRARHLRAA